MTGYCSIHGQFSSSSGLCPSCNTFTTPPPPPQVSLALDPTLIYARIEAALERIATALEDAKTHSSEEA